MIGRYSIDLNPLTQGPFFTGGECAPGPNAFSVKLARLFFYTARDSKIGFFIAGIRAFKFASSSLVANKARLRQWLTPNLKSQPRLRKLPIFEPLSVYLDDF